jgi:hypothetical protein
MTSFSIPGTGEIDSKFLKQSMLAAGIDLRLLYHLSRILVIAERNELGMPQPISQSDKVSLQIGFSPFIC